MKNLRWLISILALASTAFAAENEFSRRMSADEFARAGLGKLSPEEVARLDALFQKYSGPAAPVPVAPAVVTPAPKPAPVVDDSAARIAAAEARARQAEADAAEARKAAAAAKAEAKPAGDSFLAKAKKVFVQPGTKVEVAAIETEIDGDFDGWDEATTWRMADGTWWRVDNKPAPYVAKKRLTHPRVRIYPAALSGYWLEFVDLDLKLRVRPAK